MKALKFCSLQLVRRHGGAQRAGRQLADFFELINATGRTRWNFSRAVKFNVWRQVVWEIYWCALGQVMFQGKLVCSGIYLADVVDAPELWLTMRIRNEIGNSHPDEESQDEQQYCNVPKSKIPEGFFLIAHTFQQTLSASFGCGIIPVWRGLGRVQLIIPEIF
jgi:hypothetical protein